LEAGAIDALVRHGANKADIHLVKAPGAFGIADGGAAHSGSKKNMMQLLH